MRWTELGKMLLDTAKLIFVGALLGGILERTASILVVVSLTATAIIFTIAGVILIKNERD